ncbi:MAG: PAS domain S-box protein [Promethearchaeota archaeon]
MPPSKSKSSTKRRVSKKPPVKTLEMIFEMPEVLIVGLDRKGRITFFNKGCEKLSGYKREEVLGKSLFTTLIPKNQRVDVRVVFNDLFESKESSIYVNDWLTKRGNKRTIEWHNTLKSDQTGELEETFSIGIDITKKKQVERDLRESEKKFRTLFDNANEAMFIVDFQGNIIEVNRAASELTGYSRKALLTMTAQDITIPDDTTKIPARKKKFEEKGSLVFETVIQPKKRKPIAVEISASAIEYSRRPGMLAVMRDITARQKAEETLRLLEKAVVSSPSGIVITDLNGTIIFANQGYLDVIGKKRKSDIIGSDAMKADFTQEIGPQIMQQLKDHGFYSGEYSRYRSDGRFVDVHILATLIVDENGVPTNLMATITDVSKLKEAEAEYRHLFESVPVGLFRTKPGVGEILDVNPALVNMLGFPDKESLIKRNASSFYVDPTARVQWERKVAQDSVVRGFEAEFLRLDGRIIWVRLSSRAVRNSQGKVIYYEGTIEDITEMRHAQQALAESEERYRLFFENFSDVLLLFDQNFNIVDVSPSIETHLGYRTDELKGKFYPSLGLLPPELLPQALENTRRLFAGEQVPPVEYPFIRKDGSRIWGEVSSKQVIRDGEVVALYSLVRDIHDRKLAEIELKNINRDLELYASLLRHDLGNDLQVIFSTTEVAQMMTPEDSELHEFIEATRAAADRMTRLLDIFGRPDKEAEKAIVALIRRVVKQAMQTHKHLTITVKASSKLKGVRVTGGRLLPIAFVNLFRNVAQHAGAQPKVNVKISQKESQIQIDIVDNGPGIPKKLHAKLFERGTSSSGGGLGLNLCKRVLEAYGGSIELIVTPSKAGARFCIRLPIEESYAQTD